MSAERASVERSRATRPLRILFLSREYPPETGGGGIGSYAAAMAPALAARGHEVHVLSCIFGQAAEDSEREGVWIHRRGVRRVLPKVRRLMPSTAFRIEGALARHLEARRLGVEVDVIEAPDWMAEGLAVALLGSRPLVAHIHTPLLLVGRHNPGSFRWSRDGRVAARLERFAVEHADLVTSPSRLLAGDLAREGWFRHGEPRIIRYPVDLEAWESLPRADSSPPRVLAVGRLEARKAPELLVRAAALLAREVSDLEVVFVGRSSLRNGGSYKAWLVELAAELGAPCRFVEEVPRAELRSWYGASRVVAVVSRYDNFPFTALEAMASARPVVCTTTTGTAELLDNGSQAGAVVSVDDPIGLAGALGTYILDPAAAARAGARARALVQGHCSPELVAEQREACYREAISLWQRKRTRWPNTRRP